MFTASVQEVRGEIRVSTGPHDVEYGRLYSEAAARVHDECGLPAPRRNDPAYYVKKIMLVAGRPDEAGPHLGRAMRLWQSCPAPVDSADGWGVLLRRQRAWVEAIDLDDLEAAREQAERERAGLPELPAEVSTRQAADILGVSKDTVLGYRDAGLLRFRDLAAPGSSRPKYHFPLADVVALRTAYDTAEPPAAPPPEEPQRRRVRGERTYKHLRTNVEDD